MTEAMLPYFEKLAITPLEHWVVPELLDEKSQTQQDEKLQEKYIKEYFDPLIATIASDNTAQVSWALKDEETRFIDAYIEINEATEQKLQDFREKVVSDKAVGIDSLDIKQFLIAAYKAYGRRFDNFQTWGQKDVSAISIIGFLIAVTPPTLGKIYCQGLFHVLKDNEPLGKYALALRQHDSRPLYRFARNARYGAGFTALCGNCTFGRGQAEEVAVVLGNYIQTERTKFAKLTQQVRTQSEPPIKLRLHV